MKTRSSMAVVCLFMALGSRAQTGSPPQPAGPAPELQDTAYIPVKRDANTCVWQRETYKQVPHGEITTNIHSFTEIASGLNHLVNGEWVESRDEIDILPDGTGVATNGQHQAYFPADIYNGMIELVTPDGKHLRSRPIGLSYFDGTNSVLIGELTNSIGVVIGNNRVVYPNAFAGLKADLTYEYTKAGFEQNIIVREQPFTPESFGLDPNSARLQVLTEFFNPPQPSVTAGDPIEQAGVVLSDETLDFGATQMIRGRACLFGTNAQSGGASVAKSWEKLEGRQILIEEVPVNAVTNEILQLPTALPTSAKISPTSPLNVMSARRLLPAQRLAQKSTRKLKLASVGLATGPGLVMDYQVISSGQANYTFQGDTTYFIAGPVSLTGTTIIEGGAVLKYTNNYSAPATLTITGTLNCETAPYRPAIFTVTDDNSVGDQIPGGRGGLDFPPPGNGLKFTANSSQTLSNLRFIDMNTAIEWDNTTGTSKLTMRDLQFVDCGTGILSDFYGVIIVGENDLFMEVNQAFWTRWGQTVTLENITANGVTYLGPTNGFSSFALTNSLLAGTGYTGLSPTGAYNAFYESSSFGTSPVTLTSNPFQTSGAGDDYLADSSQARDAGTTNIDPALLTELKQKTTYPPILYSNVFFTNNITLNPQAQRDYDTPDIGYHYDPIDYLVDYLWITNGTMIVTNGAVLAGYNDQDVMVTDGSQIISIGTPLLPNWFTRYSCVQEEPLALGGGGALPSAADMVNPWHATNEPAGMFQFTKFSCPAGGGYHLYHGQQNWAYSNLLAQDCEFWSGQNDFRGYNFSSAAVKNNLFARSTASAVGGSYTNSSLALSNNLFWNTTVTIRSGPNSNQWYCFNNSFDTCQVLPNSAAQMTVNGFNAYLVGTNRLFPIGTNDVTSTNIFTYQTGPLGTFYQPTNSILINVGSCLGGAAGLYHYTTTTNELKETNSIVDIGYHYVALDANGNPDDTNGDGIPDYLEDANGNGLVDSGEIGWNINGDLGLQVIITRPKNNSLIP